MFKVVGGVQNYAWGKIGTESCVSLFSNIVDNNTPLAEYWLGTHKSLPSKLENSILSDEIGDLPYLFKLLSIAKPLSIQIHPSKSQAEYLHSLNPALYPDNNYKPEMCIAKSKMRLFLGFRPIQEINLLLNSTPELHTIVDEKTDLKMQLMSLYSDESKTRYLVREYCTRVNSGIYCELNSFYPEDPGVFFAMFMNYVELNPGEAVVIHAGVPHCYIDGECFEAMACSDNVVRAGLTPKPKDVKTLLEIMNYENNEPCIVHPKSINENCICYDSGYEEFQVFRYFGTGNVRIGNLGIGLGVVCEGKVCVQGVEFGPGSSFMVRDFVDAEIESGDVVICCENKLS